MAKQAAQIAPAGDAVGKRIFYCQDCDHYTWLDWKGSFTPSSPPEPAVSGS
jgi:hypothetical protein